MNKQKTVTVLRQAWHITYRVVFMMAALFCIFTLSFFITTWLSAWLHWHLAAYPSQLVSFGISFVLFILCGLTMRLIFEPRQHVVWQSMVDALSHMAKGNFDIHLDVNMIREPGGDQHPFRLLVHSINDMAQELAQLEQMRQEFISNVSHEIQSPLTSIQGFTSALRTGDLSPEQHNRYLEIIEAESKRLSRLSDNLLKLTSLESGYHPFHPETFRLDRQLRNTVLACEPAWLGKDIQIDLSVPPIELIADRDLLSQVWVNILSNAIKFTPEGGTITISAEVSEADQVAVRVADTGIGIAADDLDRIFERFYKANKARSSGRMSGAGLGLSIVKKIIELHGGTIAVASRLGLGSTFTVTLPRTPDGHGAATQP
ncbi:two-component sensor histidine kinase [Alicyclobacillus cycloheptanicus]|uniref:histidine kinase n=1 Tax=Alicyclobacillus cycloheptanicus TaxID=1457 RepID=A0ABT9XI60_9BACL|nr:HAMP domain-containing sensor histidine kinase [Alicyclobacillus cycloheptanicus]MDQ0189996.1 signal transduction histidine kinase [Alicyclobacillus cycloheptanicus]WDM00095.1 two-component sensor histidine kinase [Alicyclobacillus cycloheptanicus]